MTDGKSERVAKQRLLSRHWSWPSIWEFWSHWVRTLWWIPGLLKGRGWMLNKNHAVDFKQTIIHELIALWQFVFLHLFLFFFNPKCNSVQENENRHKFPAYARSVPPEFFRHCKTRCKSPTHGRTRLQLLIFPPLESASNISRFTV